MSDHTENTNPSTGSIAFDEQLVTPVSKSGKYEASREMIEASNPAVDAIIMNAIREEYALDTEAYAITTFLAGATAGTVVDISDGVTMQDPLPAWSPSRRTGTRRERVPRRIDPVQRAGAAEGHRQPPAEPAGRAVERPGRPWSRTVPSPSRSRACAPPTPGPDRWPAGPVVGRDHVRVRPADVAVGEIEAAAKIEFAAFGYIACCRHPRRRPAEVRHPGVGQPRDDRPAPTGSAGRVTSGDTDRRRTPWHGPRSRTSRRTCGRTRTTSWTWSCPPPSNGVGPPPGPRPRRGPRPAVTLAVITYAGLLYRERSDPAGFSTYTDLDDGADSGDAMANVYRLLGGRKPVAR